MRSFILRRVALIAHGDSGLVLIGSRHSANTLRIREFLTRNAQPFTYQDVESDPDVQALLDRFQVGVDDVPVVVCEGGQVLRNPSIEALASGLGLSPEFDAGVTRDVVIVGAGPAGLAAAVYAASEGLDVLVLETTAPGGQAGSSSRIENYLGFPTGISARTWPGVRSMQTRSSARRWPSPGGPSVSTARRSPTRSSLATGEVVRTRTVVIASGARYRKPALSELSRFEGAGIMYSATHVEAQLCKEERSPSWEAAIPPDRRPSSLSQSSAQVNVLVRGPELAASMSRYLIQRIEAQLERGAACAHTQIDALEGTDRLEGIRWRHLDTGQSQTRPIRHLFLMTGADPNTAWLGGMRGA